MKVSIITVVLNSAKTIERSILSVLDQEFERIEYIVIDGGSSDGTVNVLERYSDKIDMLIIEPDNGLYDAMNKGIGRAKGDIVGILNADDVYKHKKVITNIVKTFEDENADCVIGNIEIVDETGRILRFWKTSPYYPGAFLKGWHPPHPGFFVRRNLYETLGGFDTDIKISADFELMLRFIEKNQIKTVILDETIVSMSTGGESSRTIKNIIIGNINCFKAFKKNGLNVPLFYPVHRFFHKREQFIGRKAES